MRPVKPIDQTFFWLERRNQPMHVGALQLFKLPDDAPATFVHNLVDDLRAETTCTPPFDRRVQYRLGLPCWAHEHSIDSEYHIRHLALPQPGNLAELFAVVSHAHSTMLDRSRPLWLCYIIEGVSDNRVAIYYKMHHSLLDGVGAMQLCRNALADDADDTHLPAAWAMDSPNPAPAQGDLLTRLLQPLYSAGRQATSLPGVARGLCRNWRDHGRHAAYTSLTQAPRCILNQRITGSRQYAAQSYALDQIKALGDRYGATINDIVLAMCASALRRYLQDRGALPAAPLVAAVPVSLRNPDSGYGNQLGLICASLATDVTDPIERLQTIQSNVAYWKQRYRHMSADEVRHFTIAMMLPAGLNLVTGLTPRQPSFNVLISNIPGPTQTLYARGAELQAMYPVSIVLDGMALNITVISYRDQLEVGLTACRRTLPGVRHMLEYLQQALDTLERADSMRA